MYIVSTSKQRRSFVTKLCNICDVIRITTISYFKYDSADTCHIYIEMPRITFLSRLYSRKINCYFKCTMAWTLTHMEQYKPIFRKRASILFNFLPLIVWRRAYCRDIYVCLHADSMPAFNNFIQCTAKIEKLRLCVLDMNICMSRWVYAVALRLIQIADISGWRGYACE